MAFLDLIRAFGNDNRVLALSMGLAGVGIISIMYSILTSVRETHIIPPKEASTRYITQETEDALGLTTLENLISHPNYSVHEVAIRILCDRAINDQAVMDVLLEEVADADAEKRTRSLRVISMLAGQSSGFSGVSFLHTQATYRALIKALELSLLQHGPIKFTDPHWDEYWLRPVEERLVLTLFKELCRRYTAHMLVEEGYVEKWLVKQYWGDTPKQRITNFHNVAMWKSNRVVEIAEKIKQTRIGLKTLHNVGLVKLNSTALRDLRDPEDDDDVVMRLELAATSDDTHPEQVPRTVEQSEEERRLRRQHREAIVLNDGSRPLAREDIIERDNVSPN